MAGGEPIRLTSGPTSKTDPQFSSDGTKIYYLSAGSIFEVPSRGGSSRRPVSRISAYQVGVTMSDPGDKEIPIRAWANRVGCNQSNVAKTEMSA
jgi:Tol biopolymer transport system component